MNYDSTYINKKYSIGVWHCCKKVCNFCFLFLLLTCFRPQKTESRMDMTLLWEHVCLFVLFFWYVGPQNEKHIFSFLKKIIKSHIFLKLIVSSLLNCINKYLCSINFWNLWCHLNNFFFFFTQLNMLRKMVLLRKRRRWQFWEFLLL